MGVGKDIIKVLGACALFAIMYKLINGFCKSKAADCRRCTVIAKLLLWSGWDDFETFPMFVTVHSVGDIKKDGLVGAKEYKIEVAFNWSKFETRVTKDCKWEQTKVLDVPQGAAECRVTLFSIGNIHNSKLGGFTLDVKKQMLDNPAFLARRKSIR
eukprot:SRR837773.15630.p1 GENE.SRR837773.15630~~SRR837773.15630.p1  ORF type:complete len:166 (+),score=49.19 SRR837773.15630:31-498(+)